MERPVVFISYSWDSEDHKDWVLKLANDLMSKFGIDVLLDQYELSAGKDLTYFMESSIEKSTKTLLILTPNYKLNAENRKGGVGYEYSMITQELFEIQSSNKFIPILRDGDLNTSCPKYIKSKIYHSMIKNSKYLNQITELSRIVYDKPKLTKPDLGPIPDFDNPDYDPIVELANTISAREELNNKLNQTLKSAEGINLANSEIDKLFNSIEKKAQLYNEKTNFQFKVVQNEYRKSLILRCGGYSVTIDWYQAFSNSLTNSKLTISFWRGILDMSGYNLRYFPDEEPEKIETAEYIFDFDLNGHNIWRLKDKSLKKSERLIKESFSFIMEQIHEEKVKNFRSE